MKQISNVNPNDVLNTCHRLIKIAEHTDNDHVFDTCKQAGQLLVLLYTNHLHSQENLYEILDGVESIKDDLKLYGVE